MAQAISQNKGSVIKIAAQPILTTQESCGGFFKSIFGFTLPPNAKEISSTAHTKGQTSDVYKCLNNHDQEEENQGSLEVNAEHATKTSHMEEVTPQDLFLEEDFKAYDSSLEDKKISNNVSVLLIGKTGDGLSSTGNSILGEHVFKTSCDSLSTTTKVQAESRNLDARKITVVDSPSIIRASEIDEGENQFINDDTESTRHLVTDLLMGAFNSPNCQEGFDAIVMVLRFGDKMSSEQTEMIAKYKEILGSDALQKHAILAFTGGDYFKCCTQDEMTFEQWCHKQINDMQTLMKECGYRCVLFDNFSKNIAVQKNQRKALTNKIDKLRLDNGRYVKKIIKSR